mmetsp:Transcript_30977/g.46183  ORF Transcript_30977/g.46183 Transcript_30977/m.46183 type:complete len:85 (+) Transcript_30977:568-822(+)
MDVGSDPASSENDTMDASPSTPSPGEDGDEMMITVDATKKDTSVSFSESGAGPKGISASQEEDARQMKMMYQVEFLLLLTNLSP